MTPPPATPYSINLTGHPALKLSNTIEKLKAPGPDSNYLNWSWILDMHFNTTGVAYITDPSHPKSKDPNPFMKWAAHGRPCGPEPGGHPWAAHGPLVGLTQPPKGSLAGGLGRWAPVGRPAQPINSCGPLGPGHLSVFPANGSPNPAQTQQGLGGLMGALPDSHP
ncbi:hypothetical protein PCANC_16822 [Puccinia coronata f. sp. avenae]|uniref:Uncharacterized protein n=1 Tax=Puccinia coronata f. sp. avenae TaxID=200324 RepID=A0A2N5SJT2_9BASI|nr:hypothetical protein PCANC_16822 [Puccinia coronata f. sp. avenae]